LGHPKIQMPRNGKPKALARPYRRGRDASIHFDQPLQVPGLDFDLGRIAGGVPIFMIRNFRQYTLNKFGVCLDCHGLGLSPVG
jgi:hypothetical protein